MMGPEFWAYPPPPRSGRIHCTVGGQFWSQFALVSVTCPLPYDPCHAVQSFNGCFALTVMVNESVSTPPRRSSTVSSKTYVPSPNSIRPSSVVSTGWPSFVHELKSVSPSGSLDPDPSSPRTNGAVTPGMSRTMSGPAFAVGGLFGASSWMMKMISLSTSGSSGSSDTNDSMTECHPIARPAVSRLTSNVPVPPAGTLPPVAVLVNRPRPERSTRCAHRWESPLTF